MPITRRSRLAGAVHFGTLSYLTGVGDLDLTGDIVYAINVGGTSSVNLGGVTFDRDDATNNSASNNNLNIGTTASFYTPSYYPGINGPGNWNTAFSGDPDLDAIKSYGLVFHDPYGRGDISLPANILIDRDGTIVWKHIADRVQDRPHPREVAAEVNAVVARTP